MIVQYADATSSFNPRPRTEGDAREGHSFFWGLMFQSTPSHGGRRAILEPHSSLISRFNPRPRTEGDLNG
ncbi:hypothetical protein HKBW3S33_01164 [Candidatus Hakubella thermalkaliphila]|uniref:Uncharacterized protein n=1 Tax=Candidatus Hakubella thermalkaliphila TaxID=2754717 RepID=A0A6V8P7X3_9ACTN|nr:hypothetical protein HKBW3S33_01164 [Candidatus Hakubella thermalkaliphila]